MSYSLWGNQLTDSDQDDQSTALDELPLPAAGLLQPDQRLLEEEPLCQADSQVDEGVIVSCLMVGDLSCQLRVRWLTLVVVGAAS